MNRNESIILGIDVHEIKRVGFLLSNHRKLINMLKVPDLIKSSLYSDIDGVKGILDRMKIINKGESSNG
jgi:hypothetical protein